VSNLRAVREDANQVNRYHYLNHYAIYSGGYREDVMESMRNLCAKYADE